MEDQEFRIWILETIQLGIRIHEAKELQIRPDPEHWAFILSLFIYFYCLAAQCVLATPLPMSPISVCLKDVWIRTQSVPVAARRATNLATHLVSCLTVLLEVQGALLHTAFLKCELYDKVILDQLMWTPTVLILFCCRNLLLTMVPFLYHCERFSKVETFLIGTYHLILNNT